MLCTPKPTLFETPDASINIPLVDRLDESKRKPGPTNKACGNGQPYQILVSVCRYYGLAVAGPSHRPRQARAVVPYSHHSHLAPRHLHFSSHRLWCHSTALHFTMPQTRGTSDQKEGADVPIIVVRVKQRQASKTKQHSQDCAMMEQVLLFI